MLSADHVTVFTRNVVDNSRIFDRFPVKPILLHLPEIGSRGFGLTGVQVREYAFEIAERNQLHGFEATARKAAQDWFKSFLKRNPEVTIRRPEAASIDRLVGFNKPQVDIFFNCLEICCGHNSFASRIFNCDQSGPRTSYRR